VVFGNEEEGEKKEEFLAKVTVKKELKDGRVEVKFCWRDYEELMGFRKGVKWIVGKIK
jgi:hypothetical protein